MDQNFTLCVSILTCKQQNYDFNVLCWMFLGRTQDHVHAPGLVIAVVVQEVDLAADQGTVPNLVPQRIAASLVPSQGPAHAAGNSVER